ncbi:MAG: MtrB/PioB family outer membrane beta-barrel protein [Thiohalocapsa sp.]
MIKPIDYRHVSAWPAGSALLLLGAVGTSQADTGVASNTMLGNALNPNTIDTLPARDPDGLDAERYRRSPSGLLYPWPTVPLDTRTTSSGWVWSGEAELGGLSLSGDEDSAWFQQYKDLQTGPYLNNFVVRGNQPKRARFFELFGGGVGYRDQFYGANAGRYNDWKLNLFYNETPHVFTNTYRPLWSGIGSGDLSLNGLTPGGTVTNGISDPLATQQNIVAAIDAVDDSELSVIRRTGGIRIDKYLTNNWRLYGTYSNEHRDGARPFGAVFGGGGGGGNIEIPESIDYNTHEIRGGLRYADDKNALNLEAHVSLFRNNIDTMSFQNPLAINTNTIVGVPPQTFTAGRYDLYPDNDYYNLRAEYARSMPDFYRGRFTGVVSWSRMKQDDDLIAPTEFSLAGGTINGVPTDNIWNTTQALSRDSANAEIDNLLLDFGLKLQPTTKVTVRGKVRYQSTNNKSEYQTCNPLTGQWGRLLNDGSGGNFVVPNTAPGNNPADTSPFAYDNAGCDFSAIRGLICFDLSTIGTQFS